MNKYFNHNKFKKNGGFTLIELLIATAVFVSIMTVSLGSVVSILDAGRKARSLKSVMTNLNFTVESMSRDIKFGKNYHCTQPSEVVTFPPSPQNCTGQNMAPQSAISFVSSEGVNIIYKLVGTQIQKSIDGGTTFLGVTSPEVVIQELKFFVFNSAPQSVSPADNAQPRVTMLITGHAGNRPSSQSTFTLQTSVSQRVPDF
jgi:prepilin-type N-terminal cleavage/methylation domain-containing protein